MSMRLQYSFTTGVFSALLMSGCISNPSQSSEAIASAERRANMAVQRYGECITEEAEKKAAHDATPTEIASAVVADCEYIFSFYRNAQIDYANARYQSSPARNTFIRGIDSMIADAREHGRGKALSRVISIRSNAPRQ